MLALLDRNDRQEQEIARLQDQLATARLLVTEAYPLLDVKEDGGMDNLEFVERSEQWVKDYLAYSKIAAIPTSDHERRLEEARACKHGTWTIGLICVDCGQSRGKPDWTWYDIVTF